MKINLILPQKVRITIENEEEVEITESCRAKKKKDNPFSQDSAFLAVSLFQLNKIKIFLSNAERSGLTLTFDKVAIFM